MVLPLALFAILWVDLVRQLSYTWETNEQYGYGWFVPFLALGLFIRRWPNRPAPLTTEHRPLNTGRNFLLSAFCFLLCLLLLPLRVIIEINPDWPLVTWSLTLLVVALSFYAVFLVGGWRWVKYFAFPVCFILVAVQWPYRIENGLTQNLMQVVASLTVEIIGWFGVPALQRGNLIEISTGMLGVDEACSGIRSLQSTLMAALFLGELYRLRWPIRLLLVGAGLTAAFLLNVCRTLLLTWQANAHGISAIDKWHDPAGFTIAIACFFVLWALAVLIKHKWSTGGQSSVISSSEVSGRLPQLSTFNFQLSTLRRYLLAVGLWSLVCIIATEVWYRSHEPKQAGAFHWTATFPTNLPAFKLIELPERTRELIASDTSACASWSDANGSDWTVFFFRWNPTSIASMLKARIHRPERCLPASGLRLITDGGLETFAAAGLQLPFRRSTYEAEGRTLHVFFCQWEDGSEQQGGVWESKLADRIRSVLVGRRKLGQQTMEVILTGPPTLDAATAALRSALPGLVQLEHGQPEVRSQRSEIRDPISSLEH
ncbi:MAG: exosortase/archaeosortase family protein [Acidobacteriia bacterium]|nr:exosortase/archaeosortase family protein [Terriglobia bacterium]